MALVAFPWIASLMTREPLLIGLVGASVQLAWIGFPLIAGTLVDRRERLRLIHSSLTFQFWIAGLLGIAIVIGIDLQAGAVLTGSGTSVAIAVLILCILLLGIAEVIRDVGMQAVLPALTSSASLDRANSRLLTVELVAARFVGQPLGGVLLTLGASVPVLFDSLTFLVSALILRPLWARPSRDSHVVPRGGSRSGKGELLDGIRWLWRTRPLRSMTLALSWNNLMSGIAFSAFVLYAQDVLGLAAEQYGVLLAAGAAGGATGGLMAPRLLKYLGPAGATTLGAATGAIAYGAVALGTSTWAVGIALFLLSAGAMPWSVASRTLRQQKAPIELIGRVTAAHRALNFGALPLGTMLGGVMASIAANALPRESALTVPFIVAAAGMALLLPIAWREFRRADVAF